MAMAMGMGTAMTALPTAQLDVRVKGKLGMQERWQPQPKLIVSLLLGLLLAVLAFSQAAASLGLAISSFRPLGGGFFSMHSSQAQVATGLYEKNRRIPAKVVGRTGREALVLTPLNPRSLWLVGRSMEMQGQVNEARRAMLQAEKISRRDSAVQFWLGIDRLKKGHIGEGLRSFDLVIRTDDNAADLIMPRMAMISLSPEGRRHLAPYISEGNPWLLHLLSSAVKDLPRAAPVAALLIERGKQAPDIPHVRDVYETLVQKLINEKSYASALRLYPLLPGASASSLRNVGGAKGATLDEGYPPFIWSFSDSEAQGGSIVSVENGGTGLEVFGASGTVGIGATKLVAPRGNSALQWQVTSRTVNMESRAVWIGTCLLGAGAGAKAESTNLLADSAPLNRTFKMNLPADCDLLRLDLRIAGGIGRTPSSLIISGLELAGR